MMVAVTVIISQYSPVITTELEVVDVGKVVTGHDSSVINPYFPPQETVTPLSGNPVPIVVKFDLRHDLAYHVCIGMQIRNPLVPCLFWTCQAGILQPLTINYWRLSSLTDKSRC